MYISILFFLVHNRKNSILPLKMNDSNKLIKSLEVWHQFCKFILTWSEHSQVIVNDRIYTEEKWLGNLNRWGYLCFWKVATIYSDTHWNCHCEKKNCQSRWRYKSELKIQLKSNFPFKWLANIDVKFEKNVVNDHSWESYIPADH